MLYAFPPRLKRYPPINQSKFATATAVYAATGHGGIDHALGGGMMRARVHELIVQDYCDASSGTGFAIVLAQRLGGELLWLREKTAERQIGRSYALGLAEIGIDAARMLSGVLPNAAAVLRAAGDAMRCPALGAVIIELWGDPKSLDLTASRRLSLAAETSGVTALLVRIGGHIMPMAAQTRMQVTAAPSIPLAANAPGLSAWKIELLRQRGSASGGIWRVEWDHARGELRDQEYDKGKISGALVSFPRDRPPGALVQTDFRRTG